MQTAVQDAVAELAAALPAVTWSVRVQEGDRVLGELNPDRTVRIASLGKILLLMAAAERIVEDPAFADAVVLRPGRPVADSGLWQHMRLESLTVADACVLIAAVSDNLATNGLLGLIGLDACNAVARSLACGSLALHDEVRDVRSNGDPPCLASGSAADVVRLLAEVRSPRRLAGDAALQVRRWLGLNVDTSMALRGLGRDPLVDSWATDLPIASKTGTDQGVRADAGIIGSGPDAVIYAVLANWSSDAVEPLAVLEAIGRVLPSGQEGAVTRIS